MKRPSKLNFLRGLALDFLVSASVAEGCQAGDVYTLAVQVEDSAGTLVTLSHEYTVTQA